MALCGAGNRKRELMGVRGRRLVRPIRHGVTVSPTGEGSAGGPAPRRPTAPVRSSSRPSRWAVRRAVRRADGSGPERRSTGRAPYNDALQPTAPARHQVSWLAGSVLSDHLPLGEAPQLSASVRAPSTFRALRERLRAADNRPTS